MPPKRRAAGSATSTNITAGGAPTTSTSTTPPMSPTTRQRRSSTTVTTADKDLTTDAQDNRPAKKPRASSTKKATLLPVPDASLGQDTTNATAINHNTTEGTTNGESVLSTGTNTDEILAVHPASTSTEPTATPPTVPISPDEKPRRPFKARGPRGPYKPRKPKPTNSLPPPPPESGLKLLKTSNELAFKDSRPWHDYFQDRTPTYNSSTSLWDFPSPPPRVDVLAPKELNKMISDDYARMKPLPDGPGLRTSSTTKSATAKTSTGETGTQEQHQTTSPSNNDTGEKGNGQEDTQAEQPQEHDSDEETQSDDASDSDDDEDSDDNRRSQSTTPGPSGNADGAAPNKVVKSKRHKKAKKHRVRIKYSFPAPVPPLEYPYLQSAFPYENYPPPKPQATTQPDYGQHSQPLPDVWHRPQNGFAMEDLFSQEKLDYSIRMLRKQPIEAHRLRMDLYFRRGFQLASKQVLDRARVAYYGKNDYTNKHYLQVPSLYNEMDEARLRSSERSRKDVNILRSLDADGKIALCGHSLLRAIPPTSAAKSPTLETTSTESTTGAQTTATTAPPMSSGSRVIGGAFSSSVALSSSAPLPVSQSTTSTQVDEASEALARDKLAYYELNQFLGSMFSHRNLGSKAQALSPRACTILRTLMGGLEKKVVAMGCELQRAELTKRLAEIDTFLSKRHREMIRVRVGKARRERQRGREESQQAVATAAASSPDSSLASSSTPVSMSPAATAKGTGAGDSTDPTSPATFAALERRFYPIWDCDPGEYYIRTATSNNPMTHVSALASAIDDPLAHPPADGDGSPFLTPAVGGGTMTTAATATTTTTEESGWPFISNPLRIPEEMEPFWKVRNYLERLPPSSSVSSTPAAAAVVAPSTTTVTEGSSNIEQIHQTRLDLSTPEPSTSTFSSMSPLLASTMTTSAVDSRNSEIELLRHAQQAIASATRVAPPLVSSSSIAMSSTFSTTAARVTSMTSEIELLRLAQQDLARAGAAAQMALTSHSSSAVASSSSSTSTTTPSVMSMTSEIERLRLAQQELARAGGN